MSIRKFALVGTLLTGALIAGAAQARPDVQWQVTVETPTIRLPGHVVLPLPPIPVPRAVVVQPQYDARPVYESRPMYEARPVYEARPIYYERPMYEARPVYQPRRWDVDGDGIPNRYDAYPYDPRNGRGWHGHERSHDNRRDWPEDRRDWRDNRR